MGYYEYNTKFNSSVIQQCNCRLTGENFSVKQKGKFQKQIHTDCFENPHKGISFSLCKTTTSSSVYRFGTANKLTFLDQCDELGIYQDKLHSDWWMGSNSSFVKNTKCPPLLRLVFYCDVITRYSSFQNQTYSQRPKQNPNYRCKYR